MIFLRRSANPLVAIMSLAICALCAGQQLNAPPQPPPQADTNSGAQPTQSLASGLGVFVYPAKNQTLDQQSTDETACFSWAKTETGIDPTAPPPAATLPPPQQAQQPAPDPSKGSGVKGAAGVRLRGRPSAQSLGMREKALQLEQPRGR